MKLKKMMMVAAVAVAGISLAACGADKAESKQSSLEKIKEKGTLVVATSPDYAPFEFQTLIDGENKIVGSDILLAEKIAEELGVELEISAMSFDNVLTSVQNGKADVAISGVSATSERKKVFDFSDVYNQVGDVLLVQKGDVEKYAEVKDLDGVSLAVQKGSTQETYAKENLTNANIVTLTMASEAVNELKSGQVKALLVDSSVAEGYAAQNKDLGIAKITFDSQDSDGKAVAMAKGNDDLKEAINKVIAEVNENDEYTQYLQEVSKYTVVEGEE